jgi:O-antigen/teichoic acid export membrane protein
MSSQGLIKSMMTIGSAQALKILISIARIKILAVMLGPAGLGLLGIYNSLLETSSKVAGLGLSSSGVRELANAREDEETLSRVRLVLFTAHLAQGGLAMVLVWLIREPLALWLFGHAQQATAVGFIGIAVLLTLLAASQTALLQGLRRITDLSYVTVFGILAGTAAGLIGVWIDGEDGLIWFVLAQPLGTIAVALYFTHRLPGPQIASLSLPEIWNVWRPMAALGVVFMLGELASAVTLLLIQSRIAQEIGLDGTGIFAAAWGISMQYTGFLVTAMTADYYPRLTEVIRDRPASNRLMNDQIQLGLAVGGPVLLLLIGFAPWVVDTLYSNEFSAAAELVQWQAVGNVFMLASWPIAFAFVAAARSRIYLFTEIFWSALFLAMAWGGLSLLGIEATGAAFTVSYILYFALLVVLARKIHGFQWEKLSIQLTAVHGALACSLLALTAMAPSTAAIVSAAVGLVTGFFGLGLVLRKSGY